MILEIYFALSLVGPGYAFIGLLRLNAGSHVEKLILSYIASLSIMLVLLFLGGIFLNFWLASILFFVITLFSFVYIIMVNRTRIMSLSFWRSNVPNVLSGKFLMIVTLVALIIVYGVILLTRPLLDSDVVQYYLPFSREIVRSNGFTYSTGYDYNTFLKPIGVSVIYAWTYIVSGSLFSEAFRLLPIIPVIMLVLVTYQIAKQVSNSEPISILSATIFMVLPIHDRLLYYNAFYPDVFYYPLIFFVILGTINYSKTRETKYLIWIGVSFGIAGLIKAQTILFAIAFLLCLVAIEVESKKAVSLFCLAAPFFILVPNLIAEIGRPNSAVFSLGPERVALLFFASIITIVVYILLEPEACLKSSSKAVLADNTEQEIDKSDRENMDPKNILSDFASLVTRSIYVMLPFLILASLWYINNLIRFGSLIYTSNIDIPNLEWANEIIGSIFQSSTQLSYFTYIPYFFFLFVHPAVMGYIWLVPLIIGLFFLIKNHDHNYTYLLFYSVVSVIIIYSQTVYYSSPAAPYPTNPRDLVPLAPMLSIVVAYGIFHLFKNKDSAKQFLTSRAGLISIILVTYYGLMSYFHSVYVYFGGTVFNSHWIYRILTGFLSLFGLTLQQTSYQLWIVNRLSFISRYVLSVLTLSSIIAIPLFFLVFLRYGGTLLTKLKNCINSNDDKGVVTKTPYFKLRELSIAKINPDLVKTIFLIFIVGSVVVLPRAVILASQGGPQNYSHNQLMYSYGPLHELMADDSVPIHGDILTFAAPPGLQYYLPNINIIDLRYSANLAHLRSSLNSSTPFDIAKSLRMNGIRHFLFDLSTLKNLDAALNNSLTSVISNSNLCKVSRSFGSWILYDLGPFETIKDIVPLANWELDSRLSAGAVSFENNGSAVNLNLNTGASADRIAIVNYAFPRLNLSEYESITINIVGSNNSRFLIRFYLSNSTPVDISYWNPISEINEFNLLYLHGSSVRGDAYLSMISSDGQPAMACLLEVSFNKIIPIAEKIVLSPIDWIVDNRNTQGLFNFTNTEGLDLQLNQGLVNDRLTITSTSFPQVNLTSLDYLKVELKGTINARILVRAYLTDGKPLDIVYWKGCGYFQTLVPIPRINLSFRGDVYIALISNDGNPCSISITEISLIQVG